MCPYVFLVTMFVHLVYSGRGTQIYWSFTDNVISNVSSYVIAFAHIKQSYLRTNVYIRSYLMSSRCRCLVIVLVFFVCLFFFF